MRQNTLLNVRQLFKSEASKSLNTSISVIDDQRINYMLMNAQNWLAGEYDWPFLRTLIDVNVAGGAQYVALPALNYERADSLTVEVFYNNNYQPVLYGIDAREYNISNAAIGQYQTPAERWSFSDENDFEIWPVSQQGQTVRWTGQRPITTLFSSGTTFSDSATFDLDDLLVTYYACAKEFQDKNPKAAANMTALAQKRMVDVMRSYPTRQQTTRIRGNHFEGRKQVRAVPIVTVAPLGH